jgi:hypothetical protein
MDSISMRSLPGLDAFGVLERMHGLADAPPTLLMAGRTISPEDRSSRFEEHRLLLKHFATQELLNAISEALGTGRTQGYNQRENP